MKKLIVVLLAAAPPSSVVLAHHGAVGHPSRYFEDIVELEGEISAVFWRNPHPRFRLKTNENGEETVWELEINSSPIGFRSRGLSADDFPQVGDEVRVAGVSSRGDPRFIGVFNILLADGREYVNGNRELRWSDRRMVVGGVQDPEPEKVAAAERIAAGIFRVWGNNADRTFSHPPLSEYRPFLTERGRELVAAYDPGTDDPELDCRQGMPTTMFDPVPMEIVDDGDRILIRVLEYDIERTIHLNGQEADDETPGSPLGYSVGKWEDDTLVVTTTHVEWPYFDPDGTPQSDQTAYFETFRLAEDNVLDYSFTATDPVVFSQPITLERGRRWTPGVELELYDCVAVWTDSAE